MGMMLEDAQVSEDLSVKPPGFWRRQFVPMLTTPQRIVDIVMGIAAPIVCLLLDPIVFKTWPTLQCDGSLVAILGQYQIWAYVAIGLGSVTLLSWLIAGTHVKQSVSVIAGILLAGSVCALFVGIKILPGSVTGLLVVVGILGFTPFFTAFVYLRNSMKAIWYFRKHFGGKTVQLIRGVLVGMMVAVSIPTLIQWQADRMIFQAIESVLEDGSTSVEQGEYTLKVLCSICPVCYLQYTGRYLVGINKGTDTIFPRDDRLDAIYKETTGKDIRECPLFGP